jgi:hypothetical protein
MSNEKPTQPSGSQYLSVNTLDFVQELSSAKKLTLNSAPQEILNNLIFLLFRENEKTTIMRRAALIAFFRQIAKFPNVAD